MKSLLSSLSDQGKGIYETLSRKHEYFPYQVSYSFQDLDSLTQRIVTVTDSHGAQLRLHHINGRLVKADTPIGEFQYTHNAHGLFVSVQRPGMTQSKMYLYENAEFPAALTGIIDESGDRYASWTYDNKGRAISSTHGEGKEQYQVRYEEDGTRRVTNGDGRSTIYEFRIVGGVRRVKAVHGEAFGSCLADNTIYNHDGNGLIDRIEDDKGNITELDRNLRGLVRSETRGLRKNSEGELVETSVSQREVIEWDQVLPLPKKRTLFEYLNGSWKSIQETTWEYNDRSQVIERNKKYRTMIDRRYYSYYGNVTASTNYQYFYHEDGKTIARIVEDGPRSDVSDLTTYEFDTHERLISQTNALGHVVRFSEHNGFGLPQRVVMENGLVVRLSYNNRGQLEELVQAESIDSEIGRKISISYLPNGLMKRVTQPNEAWQEYDYDSARHITTVTNSLGEDISLTPNSLTGDWLTLLIKDHVGGARYTASRIIDAKGRLSARLGLEGREQRFFYDSVGNISGVSGPGQNEVRYEYDALGRVIVEKTPDENWDSSQPEIEWVETHYKYNGLNQIVQVTDGEGKITRYRYDGLGSLIELNSPDTGKTSFYYDKANNLIQRKDARGVVSEYQYDEINRVIEIEYSRGSGVIDNSDTIFIYDDTSDENYGLGRLTKVQDSSGENWYKYNVFGDIESVSTRIGSQQYTVGYRYDSDGLLESINYPSGRTLMLSRDGFSRVSSIVLKEDNRPNQILATGIKYVPYGPATSFVYGNGVVSSSIFDTEYRLTRLTSATVRDSELSYSLRDNIDSITEWVRPKESQSFSYDNASRLSVASGVYGDISYSYDRVGNRVLRTQGEEIETLLYNDTGHRLTEIDKASSSTILEYDAIGSVTKKGELSFSYDQSGRLAIATPTGAEPMTYKYNAFGQRTEKSNSEDTIHYIYGPDGELISELDGQTGEVIQEYAYLNNKPLALLTKDEKYFIHTDHLGTPKEMTDASGAVVWRNQSKPFGLVEIDEDVDGNGHLVKLNLRFAGQYFDEESGLHYNWHRYYDPSLGRYLQSDRLGLIDGPNTYAYVGGSPLNYVDPTGEFGVVGAGIGAGVDFTLQLIQYGGNLKCVDEMQILRSALLGAVGAGIGFKLAGTAGKGKVFSHWFPSRAKKWPGFGGELGKKFLKTGNKYNGNYVSKKRHYKHDNKYYGHEKGDGVLRRNEWGARWPRTIQQLDRIPNVYKGGIGGGTAGNAIGGGCECQ